ncbi:MAG: Hpt domain-containing protein, partial [Chitinophagales bacterium]
AKPDTRARHSGSPALGGARRLPPPHDRGQGASAALDAALRQLDGDRELLVELTLELLSAWPIYRTKLAQAAGDGNLPLLGEEAHSLKGALSYFGQPGLIQLVRELERAATEGNTAAAETVRLRLEGEVDELLATLTLALRLPQG